MPPRQSLMRRYASHVYVPRTAPCRMSPYCTLLYDVNASLLLLSLLLGMVSSPRYGPLPCSCSGVIASWCHLLTDLGGYAIPTWVPWHPAQYSCMPPGTLFVGVPPGLPVTDPRVTDQRVYRGVRCFITFGGLPVPRSV